MNRRATLLPIRAPTATMIRGKTEIRSLEQEIRIGLARKTKIEIPG